MQISQIPTKLAIVFGSGTTGTYIRTVPPTSGDPNAASQTLGFPPNTAAPIASGGIPPDIRDFNGFLNILSAWAQWLTGSAITAWDSAWSAAVGGYPLGAVVGSATTPGSVFRSTTDNNVTNPDSGGLGWTNFFPQSITGNAGTATRLATVRSISMTGDVSWTVNFDGSGNVTAAASVTPSAGVPPGVTWMYAANSAPAGWLICNGAAINRVTYAALFGVIGTAYGPGDGSTTFNIPNMLGQFPRGFDSGSTIDPARVFGTTQGFALENHNHAEGASYTTGSSRPGIYGDTSLATGGSFPVGATVHTDANNGTRQLYTSTGTVGAGSGSGAPAGTFAAETRPTNVTFTFIIKT